MSALIRPDLSVAQCGISRTASARLRAVGDQSLDGHLAVADRRQDAIEVLAGGVAAREQGHLLPVEIRIPEGDRLVHHARRARSARHGRRSRSPSPSPGRCRSRRTPRRSPRRSLTGRFPPGGRVTAAIDGDRLRPAPASRSNRTTSAPESRANRATPRPIGPAPTTSTRSRLGHRSAAHRMGADGEELDRRALISGQARRAHEAGCGQRQQPGHAAVLVDAEHGDPHAAVRLAAAAGDALTAGEVRVDHADLARREAGAVRRPRRPRRRARGP